MEKGNVLKSLIFEDEAVLTLIDGTAFVREGIRLHGLKNGASTAFAESLLFAAFAGASLKSQTDAVSAAIKGGNIGNLCVSCSGELSVRGYIDYPENGENGGDFEPAFSGEETFSVIRDDGYGKQPFVGTCACVSGDFDENFKEYYRVSEQLTTVFGTALRFSDQGEIAFAGAAIVQLLPFSSEGTRRNLPSAAELKFFAAEIESAGLEKVADRRFSAKSDRMVFENAAYKCNCSREYLSGVLASLGRAELEKIVREDGEIKVHCHYCNKDYAFGMEDIRVLFEK